MMDREAFDSSRINCFWSVLGDDSLRISGGEILRQKQIKNALNARRALQDLRMGRPSHRWPSNDESQLLKSLTLKPLGPDSMVSELRCQDDYLRAANGSFWKHAELTHQNQSETLLHTHRHSNGSTNKVHSNSQNSPFQNLFLPIEFVSRTRFVRPTGPPFESTTAFLVHRQRNPEKTQRRTHAVPRVVRSGSRVAAVPIARRAPRRQLRRR